MRLFLRYVAVVNTRQTVRLTRVRHLVATGDAERTRTRAGLSKREMARAIDVSPSTIMRWERGDRRPRGDEALRYLALLDALSAPTTQATS